MLNAVLIDDEKIALQELIYVLTQYEEIRILGAFTDPLEALKHIPKLNPNVIFLDIEMPEINGFAVAQQIIEFSWEPYIVFVTAYDEYAIKAFEVNAIDYILKPISPKRIHQTIQKLIKNNRKDYSEKNRKNPWKKKIASIKETCDKEFSKIFVYQGEEIILLNPSDVLYLMIEEGAVTVITQQKSYKIRETLNYWEERLSRWGFFRCHRCYLVNMEKIEKILPMFHNTYLLRLANSSIEIPVSRNYGKILKQMML